MNYSPSRFAILGALVFATFLATSAAAGIPPPSATNVIHHYIDTVGGDARLHEIHTLRMRGAYAEGTFRAYTVMERKRPNFRVVSVGGYCEGFDGAAWEHNTHSNKITRTSGAAAAASRRGSEFDESFVDAAAKHNKVEFAGEHTIGKQRTWLLRVTLSDGWRKDYYMDEHTGLIDGLEVSMPLHARGKPVTSISLYEDYRRVSGVLFPFRQVESNVATGKTMNVLQWSSIEVNPHIMAADFHPPCAVKDQPVTPGT